LEVTLLNDVPTTEFKNGLIYFEGGNIEIKGTCKGQLTVVSAESPAREPVSFTINKGTSTEETQSIYTSDANLIAQGKIYNPNFGKVDGKQISSLQSNFRPYNPTDASWDGMGNQTSHSVTNSNTNNIYKNYQDLTSTELTYCGGKSKCQPIKDSSGRWIFPTSGDELQKTVMNDDVNNKAVFRALEREGNVTIAGNVEYKGADTSLGVIAKNFILLNQDGAGNGSTLKVRGAYTSFDHSVQFDDVNMSNKNPNNVAIKNGKFNFTGSMISQFSDAEGKSNGKGYVNHDLTWDQNLKFVLPPNFPKWNIYEFNENIVVEFVVLGFEDLGAPIILATPTL
jgi:hypothetical protein